MNISHFVIICALLAGWNEAYGEIAAEAPEARQWADSLTEKQLREIKAPLFISVVESFAGNDKDNGAPKFKDISYKECKQVSYLDCMSPANANFAVLLNDASAVKGLTGVFAITGADSVAYFMPKGFFLSSSDGKSSVQISTPPKEGKVNIQDLTESIITSLGYDGVVLAINEDFALVGSTENRLKRINLQGLGLADSHKKWSLATLRKKGAILLSLVNASGPYGVFRIVVGGETKDTLQVGSKIILESK